VNLGSNFSPLFELKSLLIQGTLDEVLKKSTSGATAC